MAFVGNVFHNYDSTAERSGVPDASGLAFYRRGSVPHEEAEEITSGGMFNRRRSSAARAERPEVHRNPSAALHDLEKGDVVEPYEDSTPERKGESDSESQGSADKKINRLARTITNWSQVPSNPFEAEKDSELDPQSSNFRARSWMKSVLKLSKEEGGKERSGGVAFRGLSAHGWGSGTDYQKNVTNVLLEAIGTVKSLLGLAKPNRIDILRDFEGLVESGEMLVVLGPPGSGCSTFLKTMTGEVHGFEVDSRSYLNYQGVPAKEMHKYFRGEAIYTAEVDVHFPMLTVGDTLYFAARARAPRETPGGVSKHAWAEHLRDVVMAAFGISHTINTRVGNDFIRGVSGGERKRVSIAEAVLSGAPMQAWDNSTRGLDSANAIEFCKTVRLSAELAGCAAMVAIYQAPQSAYDQFDKAIVLYEGRQIFFGRTTEARAYFENIGFQCPDRQTTADFLTSMTSSQERVVRPGWEKRVPRTPDEFAKVWKNSPERAQLLKDIDAYDKRFPFKGESYQQFVDSRKQQQAKGQRIKSPFTLSYTQQVQLCLWRGFRRLTGDPELTFTQLFGNFAMALILGSVFYNMSYDTNSFFSRGAVLFFAVLINAFGSALEILTLYAQRPIVEKHNRYAFYHPSAEAWASMLTDMPYKFINAFTFNIPLYFMVNLKREAGAFFFFLLVSFLTTVTMSMLFRTIGSVSRTLSQAMAPAAVIMLAIVIFTGFAIPTDYMLGWCRWINYIDPVAYTFESLMVNEFAGTDYACSAFVPSTYGSLQDGSRVCSSVGSEAGLDVVQGTVYLESAFAYYPSHKWRNVGIIIAFGIGFMGVYLTAVELIQAKKSKGEVLVFQRGHIPAALKEKVADEESVPAGRDANALTQTASYTEATDIIQKQTAIFSWKNVCYDIKIKGQDRRILDHVDGWVKPGTLTALMGVSGAGKTTLLDVLATRVTMGVISGDMLVDGRQRDSSFQRKTGYVQQQDLHLSTTTVREALEFSALLRQPRSTPRSEKIAYVDEVIKLLDMQEYADAVVGVPGEGLNVEQRKRLTIGVELAAKPQLLLFLDEPTSGLDSQTSWAICDLMEKLKNSGQAILCTIHQPSAMLFQRFDRLLFLAKGGRTVYFGEVGTNSNILSSYFERNGAKPCPKDANPAEWMLEVIGAAPGTYTEIDWHQVWRDSPEYEQTHKELENIRITRSTQPTEAAPGANDQNSYREFAAPFVQQTFEVTKRVFAQYWRTPSYIWSKTALCVGAALFVGFIFFKAPLTQQGLTNQMFSIFMIFTVFGQLVSQIMPHFVTQRALYEVRERPSKTYSWQSFMIANIAVELPWNSLMAVLMYFCYYYPVGLYGNAGGEVAARGFTFFLFMWQFLLFTSTFTTMVIAGMSSAETGGNVANLMFSLCLIFCGVLAGPDTLPGFWIFMYRVSPFTYLVSGLLSTGIANTNVQCASNEFLQFNVGEGFNNCADYLQQYMNETFNVGYLRDSSSTSQCEYCTYSDSNTFLSGVSISYGDRWRNFGILWVYIIFNTAAAVFLYWLARVPKQSRKARMEAEEAKQQIQQQQQTSQVAEEKAA
ncbi:hypothetical protein CBER1_06395 [Cercospora berteroae]|uniref:ABC transporter domain-containing protein n=1 Tax=Cercospora berteroae TaxID=357750 RepID=A0A2S6C927_9PEZI|nr:hypothetical protein CBER1_06395 [Cercospora berteroae]